MADEIFAQFTTCRWEVTGYNVVLPVKTVRTRGGNRIVPRERANRNGAKLDDTGSKPKVWTLDVDFYNGIDEPDMPADDMYPSLANDLEKSCDIHETGTLTLPTIGKRRCRLLDYDREESFEERDTGRFSLTFMEDNEDAITASSFSSPSARSVSRQLAEATTASAEQDGIELTDIGSSLTELASELEGLANAPFEYVGDLQAKAGQISRACARIEAVHTSAADEVGLLLTSPMSSRTLRKLRELNDTAARVVQERLSSMPVLVPFRVASQRTLFDVAASLNQDAALLLKANPDLPNPLAIDAGTTINVYES